MGERRGTKALEIWCRRITDGYPGVKVDNMTTSWRDGLAFCALIHHFRPDLIDFSSLKKEDVYHNNELAFRTAESYLGIPALLDAEDMAQYAVPDRLSILTYLSQYYQYFASSTAGSSPSRMMTKRSSSSKECDNLPVSPASTSPPTKMSSGALGRREPCSSCGQPVFLAQRLLVGRTLYHRTCFRCARCGAQLSLASCYETETAGQYCCEICPDEEKEVLDSADKEFDRIYDENVVEKTPLPVLVENALSDEEKTRKLLQSSMTTDKINGSSATKLSNFLGSQLEKVVDTDDDDDDDVLPPELPKSLPPDRDPSLEISQPKTEVLETVNPLLLVSSVSDNNDESMHSVKNTDSRDYNINSSALVECANVAVIQKDYVGASSDQIDVKDVNMLVEESQRETASVFENDPFEGVAKNSEAHDVAKEEIAAKDTRPLPESNTDDEVPSLVKSRMKIFEESSKAVSTPKTIEINNKLNDKDSDSSISIEVLPKIDDSAMLSSPVNTEQESQNAENTSNYVPDEEKNVPSTQQPPLSHSEKENVSTVDEVTVEKSDPVSNVDSSKNDELTSKEEEITDVKSDIADHEHEVNTLEDAINVTDEPLIEDTCETKPENAIFENVTQPKIDIVVEEVSSPSEDVIKDDDLNTSNDKYPESLNPFSDDDDESVEEETVNNSSKEPRKSLNPFDESDEENQNEVPKRKSVEKPPRPPLPAILINAKKSQTKSPELRKITPPSTRFNPFSSDEDENSDEEKSNKPSTKDPKHKTEEEPTSILSIQSFYGSSSSLTSTVSRRKKAPAPKPPGLVASQTALHQTSFNENTETSMLSQLSSPSSSMSHISPQVSPRLKKRRPAPRPPTFITQPSATSTLVDSLNVSNQNLNNSDEYLASLSEQDDKSSSIKSFSKKVISSADFDNDPDISIISKDIKPDDEKADIKDNEGSHLPSPFADKSSTGQWKRRKGPAPGIPLLQKRDRGPPIPPAVIRRELQLLEDQQRGLERQGVRLEEIIRERCESGENAQNTTGEPDPETDELVLQLFELVNEKNELFRRQAELMYIRRQQRLEEEYADLEHQIRLLMSRPEANKTDSDKTREEQLIQRLVEVVERRDEVIASLEMDRLREKEEDKSIRERMASHRAKRDENSSLTSVETPESVPKKEKKKEKKRWLKKDKDKPKIHEDEKVCVESPDKIPNKKEKKHKKWF